MGKCAIFKHLCRTKSYFKLSEKKRRSLTQSHGVRSKIGYCHVGSNLCCWQSVYQVIIYASFCEAVLYYYWSLVQLTLLPNKRLSWCIYFARQAPIFPPYGCTNTLVAASTARVVADLCLITVFQTSFTNRKPAVQPVVCLTYHLGASQLAQRSLLLC